MAAASAAGRAFGSGVNVAPPSSIVVASLDGGTRVAKKVTERLRGAGRAPGATPKDIPWLKLDVSERRGSGVLSAATTIQRINTQGGVAEGPCDKAGAFLSAAYATDYVFLKK